jgi:hypothetical protein
VKQKILVVLEVEYSQDSSRNFCSMDCPFVEQLHHDVDSPVVCRLFVDGRGLPEVLERGQNECHQRRPRCLAAAGNHNIVGKCLAGE